MRFSCVLLLCAAGCGRIEYGESDRPVMVAEATTGGAVVVAPPATAPAPAAPPGVVYVPWDPGAAPAAPPVASIAAPAGGAVQCSGAERVRIHDRFVDGGSGPAVVATGACVVEVSEAILRGEPAVFVADRARVEIVESRIQGDVRSTGGGRVSTHGCRHDRGSVQHF